MGFWWMGYGVLGNRFLAEWVGGLLMLFVVDVLEVED